MVSNATTGANVDYDEEQRALLVALAMYATVLMLFLLAGHLQLQWIFWLRQGSTRESNSEDSEDQHQPESPEVLHDPEYAHVPPLISHSIRVDIDTHINIAKRKRNVLKLLAGLLLCSVVALILACYWIMHLGQGFGLLGVCSLICIVLAGNLFTDPAMPRHARAFFATGMMSINASIAAMVAGIATTVMLLPYALFAPEVRSADHPELMEYQLGMSLLMWLWVFVLFINHININRALYVTKEPLYASPKALIREQKNGGPRGVLMHLIPSAYYLEASSFYAMPIRLAAHHIFAQMQRFGIAMGLLTIGFSLVMAMRLPSSSKSVPEGAQVESYLTAIDRCRNTILLGSMLPVGVAYLVILGVGFSKPVRRRFTHILARIGISSPRARQSVAATLLMGEEDPHVVLQRASATFRGIPMRQLSPSMFSETFSRQEVHAQTRSLELGGCDAFLSHSWHDDWTKKYGALTEWKAEQHARSTTEHDIVIWWDKACINVPPNRFSQALACLPVYIAGCHRMIVLAGPTFTQRLWCVMELFMFCEVGAGQRCIDVHNVGVDSSNSDFHNFDIARTRCVSSRDKHYFVSIIETAFGGYDPFNAIVQGILTNDIIKQTNRG